MVRRQHRPTEAIQFLVPLRLQVEALVVALPILRIPALPADLVVVVHPTGAAGAEVEALPGRATAVDQELTVRQITVLAVVAVQGLLDRTALPQRVEMAALVWHQALAAHL